MVSIMNTLKDFYCMIEDDDSKHHNWPTRCDTCEAILVGPFTSLPDYEKAFCKVEDGMKFECFEQFALGEITGYADHVYDQMKERRTE